MSEPRPSPAGGSRAGVTPPGAGRPGTVRVAVSLMLLGAVLEVVSTAVAVLAMPRVTAVVLDEMDLQGYAIDPADLRLTAGDHVGQILLGAVVALVWLWMARKNAQGRRWA